MPAVQRMILASLLLLLSGACHHFRSPSLEESVSRQIRYDSSGLEPDRGVCMGGTATARIHVLMAQGKFADAEALIARTMASGLLSKPHATQLLDKISTLNTKLGELPARLQRAPNFPSQLKDHTLFQIRRMLDSKDFSLATEAQLKLATKLLKETPRVMEKAR